MKAKFKVGDKVKILSTSSVDGITNHGVRIGTVGKVIDFEFDGEYGYDVQHSNFKHGWWWFEENSLELVED